jgi:hypothetical protein
MGSSFGGSVTGAVVTSGSGVARQAVKENSITAHISKAKIFFNIFTLFQFILRIDNTIYKIKMQAD